MQTLQPWALLRRFANDLVTTLGSRSSSLKSHWSAETLEGYEPNGYHPLVVGDVLGSDYHVVRKLGWGISSTVWLVKNPSNPSQPFSALKVLSGVGTGVAHFGPQELEFLQRMRNQSSLHPGHSHVIQLRDHFYHHGPNGRHLCLVLEPLTENLQLFYWRWKDGRLGMPKPLLKRITRQVLLGLDYLHNECNIIHTDIKPTNILLAAPDDGSSIFDAAIVERSFDISVGKTSNNLSISRYPSCPVGYPSPSGDPNSDETWDKVEVKLADVGVSCWADKVSEHWAEFIQSSAVRAPEVCIGSGWGKPADIWSLGCTIVEMAIGEPMITPDINPRYLPYIHYSLFGDFPLDMLKQSKYSDNFFKTDGSINATVKRRSLRGVLFHPSTPPSSDADEFIDFLQLMFKLDPSKRATCQELLAHKWLST